MMTHNTQEFLDVQAAYIGQTSQVEGQVASGIAVEMTELISSIEAAELLKEVAADLAAHRSASLAAAGLGV